MAHGLSRRQLLALGACAGAGLACPALGQPIHTPSTGLDRWHRVACGQCGLVDPLLAGQRDGKIVALKGDPLAATSLGRLCTRGMGIPAALGGERRLTSPLIRRDPATRGRADGLEPVGWDEAAAWIADRLSPLFSEGRAAVLLDTDLPCETQFDAGRLFRGLLGCANVDSSLRLDGVAGLQGAVQATGIPGPTGTAADVDGADLFLLVGADPAARHATLFYRMVQCQRRNRTRTVVIDPRRTLSCGLADVFVRPRVPGTDAAILRSIAHVLLREGVEGDPGLPGHDDFVAAARAMSPARAAELSGAKEADIEAAAAAFAESAQPFTAFGRGLMRGGTRAVRTLFDLHLFTGQLEAGATVLPLLEGANAAGAYLMGASTGRLPGLRDPADADDRAAAARAWDCSPDRLPPATGLRLGQWLPALEAGSLGGLVLLGGNPLPRLPDNARWRAALAAVPVVHATPVQPTETTAWSDLVLPMGVPWLEERGVFVSCDRRVVLTNPGPRPTGVPSSLEVVATLAEALAPDRAGDWTATVDGPEAVWEACRAATAGRDCDLSGLTYGVLTDTPGPTWPRSTGAVVDAESPEVSSTLAPIRRALSADAGAPDPAERASDTLAFLAVATVHHTSSRELTGFAPDLHYASPRAWIEVSGRDATRRGLRDGSFAAVESPTGVLVARIWISDRVPRGLIAVPDHFAFLSDLEGGSDGRGEAPSMTSEVVPLVADPDSGQLGTPTVRVVLRAATEDELERRILRRG